MNANKADLKNAVSQWADRIGVKVREIHLRQMQRKWASISTKGQVDPQHGPARPAGGVDGVCDCP